MYPMKKLIISALLLASANFALAADLSTVSGAVDAAKNLSQQIQQKVDSSPVVREINQSLPSKDQAEGFLSGLWRIIWSVVKFLGVIFTWIIDLATSFFSAIFQKIGLGFFTS